MKALLTVARVSRSTAVLFALLLLAYPSIAQSNSIAREKQEAEKVLRDPDREDNSKATTRGLMALAEEHQGKYPKVLGIKPTTGPRELQRVANWKERTAWETRWRLRRSALEELYNRVGEIPAQYFMNYYIGEKRSLRTLALDALQHGIDLKKYGPDTPGLTEFARQIHSGKDQMEGLRLSSLLKDNEAVPQIAGLLASEKDINTRHTLAHFLYLIGSPEAMKALRENHILYDADNPDDPYMKRAQVVVEASQTDPKPGIPRLTIFGICVAVTGSVGLVAKAFLNRKRQTT